MAERSVTIRISATDNFSTVLNRYQREMGESSTATRNLATGSEQSATAFGTLRTALVGLGGVWATLQLGRKALELRDLGAAATAANNTFTALSGGTVEAATSLQMMRDATRGMADDTTLMQGASRLLLMDLASTSDEAARLTEIAVNLGRAMGKDAGRSIEEFSLLLSNRSILRLDNFGISAIRVRERIEELKEAGAGVEEAFNTAVLEVGASAMGRLGDSIAANVTEWDTLGVRIKNTLTDIGQGFAGVGEVIATGANDALDAMEGIVEREEEIKNRIDNLITGGGAGDAGGVPGSDPTGGAGIPGADLLTESQRAQALEILRSGELDSYQDITRGTLLVEQVFYGEVYDQAYLAHQALMQVALDYYTVESAAQSAQDAAAAHASAVEAAGRAPATPYELWSGPLNTPQLPPELAAAQGRYLANRPTLGGAVSGFGRGITRAASAGAGYFDDTIQREQFRQQWQHGQLEQARNRNYSNQMWNAYGDYRSTHTDQTFGAMFGGLENAGSTLFNAAERSAGVIADAMAQAAAEAQQIVGTFMAASKPTGPEGDLYREIANNINDPEARAQFERSVGLTNWRDDFMADIGGMAPTDAAWAARNLTPYFASGQMPASYAQGMNWAGFFQAPGSSAGGYTINSGDTLSGIAAANGMSVQQLRELNPGVDPYALQVGGSLNLGGYQRIVGAGGPEEQGDAGFGMGATADPYQAAADATGEMAGNMGDAASAASEVQSTLETIAGMVAQATIEARLTVTGDTWAIPLLGASGTLNTGSGKKPGLQGASTVTANTTPRGSGGVQAFVD